LSACSSYFQKLLLENPCKHPTIIMPQDVCFSDLKFIIEFVYRGEIDVSQAELQVCNNNFAIFRVLHCSYEPMGLTDTNTEDSFHIGFRKHVTIRSDMLTSVSHLLLFMTYFFVLVAIK
jgi:hypothetical protein